MAMETTMDQDALEFLNNFDPNDQSYLAPGPYRIRFSYYGRPRSETKGEVGQEAEREPMKFLTHLSDDATTLYSSFQRGLRESRDSRCLGWRVSEEEDPNPNRPFQWLSYSQVLEKAKNFGVGLRHLGVEEKSMVGMYSVNRPEYVIAEQALFAHSMVTVPLYDTLGPDACSFIINQTDLTTIVCDDNAKVRKLLENLHIYPKVQLLISMDQLADRESLDEKIRNSGLNLRLFSFSQVEELGKGQRHRPEYAEKPPAPEDICAILFTSGTTGDPKGAVLTHGNLIAEISATMIHLQGSKVSHDDVSISYMPLAHIYERFVQGTLFMVGGSVGFFGGDISKLMDDMRVLQPTILPAVPRILNRLYDKLSADLLKCDSVMKQTLLQVGLNRKLSEVQNGILRTDTVWDWLIFNKTRESVGGRVRIVFTGAAPISRQTLDFFRCALSCHVIEVYGTTECSGPITTTLSLARDLKSKRGADKVDVNIDHGVGPPTPANCIKLIDVPEMSYFRDNDEGEVCIKGPNVFQGYFKNPEVTRETFDEDGFLKTGDIGQWQPNGTLKIIDRRKNIFKMAQGEYIVPERVEGVYLKSRFISQIFVHGEPLLSFLVAIVIPDVDYIQGLLSNPKLTLSEICRGTSSSGIKARILKDMQRLADSHGLCSFEQVKSICVYPQLFTLENGLLTPTMKSKRAQLKAHFKAQIEQLYANPPQITRRQTK